MIYRMREEREHVVTVYGFDVDSTRHVALLAMELGGESLLERAFRLHSRAEDDFIPTAERKNIWMQLVNILVILHRRNIVRIRVCSKKKERVDERRLIF